MLGLLIGFVQASYSLMQFLCATGWGSLSDRIGRRPVLLVSTAAAAISYVLFAFGCNLPGHIGLWVVLASRLLAGVCGANITVAQAYIAHITPPETRPPRMQLIRPALPLGLVFPPPLASPPLH